MRQSKTSILSTNVYKKSLETEFSIAVCRPKTLFLAILMFRAFSIAAYPVCVYDQHRCRSVYAIERGNACSVSSAKYIAGDGQTTDEETRLEVAHFRAFIKIISALFT